MWTYLDVRETLLSVMYMQIHVTLLQNRTLYCKYYPFSHLISISWAVLYKKARYNNHMCKFLCRLLILPCNKLPDVIRGFSYLRHSQPCCFVLSCEGYTVWCGVHGFPRNAFVQIQKKTFIGRYIIFTRIYVEGERVIYDWASVALMFTRMDLKWQNLSFGVYPSQAYDCCTDFLEQIFWKEIIQKIELFAD